ncbi:MAG TPA: hypothetical protein VJ732_05905 [Bryobacteraceae bacterium]|nr:hypothetical protein [Bryobacteraceae bacterium]
MENVVPLEQRGAINYYMARNCADAGMNDRAVAYLRKAIDEGYITAGKIARDDSFASLRNDPAFQQLLAEQGNQ